jgi:hypothetical protein
MQAERVVVRGAADAAVGGWFDLPLKTMLDLLHRRPV